MWSSPVVVYRESDEAAGPLLQGVGSEIWEEIQKLADNGLILVLRAPV